MASTKRKTAVKRTAKNAASNVRRSTSHFAHQAKGAAQTANRAGLDTAAQFFQLPFAQGDVGEATRQATQAAQSATENMVKMGTDFWQNVMNSQQWNQNGSNPAAAWSKMFSQASGGNPFTQGSNPFAHIPGAAEATEHAKRFGRDAVSHAQRTAGNAQQALTDAAELSRENLEALTQSGSIAASAGKELGAEIVSYANRAFAQNVELGKQVLGCRTLNDMFDLSGRILKTNLDNFFSESVRLSELAFQAASDVSEPLNERISETTSRLTKTLAA